VPRDQDLLVYGKSEVLGEVILHRRQRHFPRRLALASLAC
jgi:hypothetical protein